WSNDGWSIMSDSRYETRELGLFLLFERQRESFTRAEVYNLRREHQFSSYPVYWAGRATNEESLSYLTSIIDSAATETNRLSDGAATYLIRVAENERDIELRKSAIAGLGRIAGDKSLGALTSTLDSSPEVELQKQAVRAIGRRPKDEAIPILIRTARSHPNVE